MEDLVQAIDDLRPSYKALLVAAGLAVLSFFLFATDREGCAGPLLILVVMALIAAVLLSNSR